MLLHWRHRASWTLLTALAVALGAPAAGAQTVRLAPFDSVRGQLNVRTLAEEWTFEGRADAVISLVATTASGDLDPVLQVLGPDGSVIAENDDLDSLVHDAGLEALRLPADGIYTARVLRYGGAAGSTAGEYDLMLTPGFARPLLRAAFDPGGPSWVTAGGEPVALAQGWLRLRASSALPQAYAFPPDLQVARNIYVEASARLFGTASYAEAGLVVRAQGPGLSYGYRFKVNTEGAYSVELQDASGTFVLRSWTEHPALAGTTWQLAVLARDSTFAFYANGTLLDTVEDGRLAGEGTVGLLVGAREGSDLVTVLFDNAAATTRLGSTYRGLPLALTTWESSDPQLIVGELAASGQVDPRPNRAIYLTEKPMVTLHHGSRFDLIGTDTALWEDFVYEARVHILAADQDVGCGLVFRWQDERHFDLVYVDTLGGFGVIQTRDGALTTNVYDESPMVIPHQMNKLLIVAHGETVAFYVNGALVAQERVEPGEGRAGAGLLNYSPLRADCYLSNLWVWPLES